MVHNPGMNASASLTDLIHQATTGDEAALKLVFDATYADLRKLARVRLRRGDRGEWLDTTVLVHESYLRFARAGRLSIESRQHFLRYAGHVMRSVIVDFAREAQAERRGGFALHVTLDTAIEGAIAAEEEILSVHEALDALAQYDARIVQVVEMRYFAGMTETEIA
ncbi:MAG TPA: ECF-type sigma factor, partial [Steroidobacteraceae bacterium]|nr:ECF-type sigma factor [Steroidobacteraceae bacterium]